MGFFTFLAAARTAGANPRALKGQTTGPITFCTGLADRSGRAIFYDEQLRDVAVKHLAMKARWQCRKMADLVEQPIMFFDEPGLAGLGSSALITVTHEDILACFAEVFEAARAENGLVGVHVCANTEWSVLFEAEVDILSFDAYGYFDKLILYRQELVDFIDRGGILASGIVPTSPEAIDRETVDSLVAKWREQTSQLAALGVDDRKIFAQTLITPSCGTGTVSIAQAEKVLRLTREVSERLRASYL